MLIVKIHTRPGGRAVLSVCDKALLGTKIEEGDSIIDLSSDFYKGEKMDRTKAADLIRKTPTVMLVGEEAINTGIQENLVDESSIKRIDGVPHAQIFSMN